jgi:mannosyltransferase
VPPLGRDLVRQTAIALAGRGSLLVVLALATLVVAGGLVAALRSRDVSVERRWHLGLILCWIVIPPVLLAIVCLHQQMWVDRYLIGIVPAFGVLAGMAVQGVRAHAGTAAAGVLAAVVLLGALRAAAGEPHPPWMGEDLRGAAAIVSARAQPGDQMVFAPAFARVGLEYYLDRAGRRPHDLALDARQTAIARGDLFPRELPEAQVATRLRSSRRVWVLGYGGLDRDGALNWHPTPEPVMAVGPKILATRFRPAGSWTAGGFTIHLYRHV